MNCSVDDVPTAGGLRVPLAVLNELSLPSVDALLSVAAARSVLETFDATLREARAWRGDLVLVSPEPLPGRAFAESAPSLAAFARQQGGQVLERYRRVRQLSSRAPYLEPPPLDEEYQIDESAAIGLGLAAAQRQLAVSFAGKRWDRNGIDVECLRLESEPAGNDLLSVTNVSVTHAMRPAHVRANRDEVRRLALPEDPQGMHIWADRKHLFARIEFLPAVERQLVKLDNSSGLTQAIQQLLRLDSAFADWQSSAKPLPSWETKVTREFEQRRRECTFTDLDGESRCFDWHARFTPDPGRIHFRLRSKTDERVAVVAHIGPKLHADM